MREKLIPPDPLDEPLLVVTNGELTRFEYEGHISWSKRNRYLSDYEQDRYEEAFEMGVQAAQQRVKAQEEQAYGRGVMDATKTLHGGKR